MDGSDCRNYFYLFIERRRPAMTENAKLIEALENTFNSNINDWVEEVMWDYKLEKTDVR